MFLELVDSLRCVRTHEDSWLIARADELVDRHIVQGELGCPVCEARYPIRDGVADFRGADRTLPTATSSAASARHAGARAARRRAARPHRPRRAGGARGRVERVRRRAARSHGGRAAPRARSGARASQRRRAVARAHTRRAPSAAASARGHRARRGAFDALAPRRRRAGARAARATDRSGLRRSFPNRCGSSRAMTNSGWRQQLRPRTSLRPSPIAPRR